MQQLNGAFEIEMLPPSLLVPYENNARTHSPKQIGEIANSINEFGFNNPILIDEKNGIIAGHGRHEAAIMLKLQKVPCIRLSHLSENQRRAYILADNRIAENSGWNYELLSAEVTALLDMDIDIDALGFSNEEINKILQSVNSPGEEHVVKAHMRKSKEGKDRQKKKTETRCQFGDTWRIGQHTVICGDPKKEVEEAALMGDPITVIEVSPYSADTLISMLEKVTGAEATLDE